MASRTGKPFTASKTTLRPDARYGSLLAARFICSLMRNGKKTVAESIFYRAMDEIKKRLKRRSELAVFEQAIECAKPIIEVRSKRTGLSANQLDTIEQTSDELPVRLRRVRLSANQMPMLVPSKRQQTLAIRWIINAARDRKGRPMHSKLADELIAAYNRGGSAIEMTGPRLFR